MKRANTISRSVEICLRFIGLWPNSAYATLYWITYMATLVIMQYCQYAYIVARFELNNIWLLMDCLSLTLAYTLVLFKLIILWWNRRIFHCVVKAMDQDWKECTMNDSYASTMMSMADVARRLSNIVFTFNTFVAFSLSIGEHYFQSMSNANQIDNSSQVSPRELPIKMELPFDVSKSPIFECFLIGQFFYDTVVACTVGMVNVLLVTLVLHVSGQIDIMQQNLIEISNKKYDRSIFLAVIKTFIYKHQRIIILSENIENLFTHIALVQILWNTVVMCCTGFVIIIMIDNGEGVIGLIKPVSYYFAITLEAFVFCFAGEFLSAKSKSIGEAIYGSLWYNLSPSDTRILKFIMLRCQKRLTITAGGVIDLTLEGFTSIMKASVSYVSVLNAMY
ncbi:ObirOr5-V24 [Ooceraea biroi]|uniref:Odorant receptor n=2 Tax=Ooceraea biroi TaxID=2015173 RepID=A0A3L8DY96_OOCBI|nr:putative odorant receptor 92a isoform X1 [Ooceraea biroi]RLU25262.1 ObirOr5-V24 [Ooceraea biroi]